MNLNNKKKIKMSYWK